MEWYCLLTLNDVTRFLVSAELLVLSTVVSCPNTCSGSTFGVMSFIAHRSAVAVVFFKRDYFVDTGGCSVVCTLLHALVCFH